MAAFAAMVTKRTNASTNEGGAGTRARSSIQLRAGSSGAREISPAVIDTAVLQLCAPFAEFERFIIRQGVRVGLNVINEKPSRGGKFTSK